jgi:signal transduction histidine kinase
MKLRTKMLMTTAIPTVIGIAILAAVVQWWLSARNAQALVQLREMHEDAITTRLQSMLDLALAQAAQNVKNGASEAEVVNQLMSLRIGEIYFVILQINPRDLSATTFLAHPTIPSLNGTNAWNMTDKRFTRLSVGGRIIDRTGSDGQKIPEGVAVQDAVRAAQQGGKRFSYYWPKPKPGGGVTE